jgi:hypothetical protein
LLEHGADPNRSNTDGASAFILACLHSGMPVGRAPGSIRMQTHSLRVRCVELMLLHGADPQASHADCTALDILQARNPQAAAILEAAILSLHSREIARAPNSLRI